MAMARLAASASTAGGRDSGWPSGPVMPCAPLPAAAEDQLAVLGMHRGHGAQLQRAAKLFTRVSSSHMMAFL
jgi:hypothetical protein